MPDALDDVSFDSPAHEVLRADAAFWRLYASSFPSNEREPAAVILESIRQQVGVAVRARVGGATTGLAVGHMLQAVPVLFVVYLAVAPEYRSRRIGTSLFERLRLCGADRYATTGIKLTGEVWEVDGPEVAVCEEEMRQRQRRIAFFTRLGAQLLPNRYIQPPVDGVSSVPMQLMFRTSDERAPTGHPEVSIMIRAIYFEKYHRMNGIPRPVLEYLLREIETK